MHFQSPPTSYIGLCTLVFTSTASAFYLPGVAPTTYKKNDKVELNVNRLTPAPSDTDNHVQSVFSFDYYHDAFHFCKPEPEGPKDVSESLGSIIFGDRIYNSPFELNMMQNKSCKASCGAQKIDHQSARFVNGRIWQNYYLNFLIDGLPAGQPYSDPSTNTEFTLRGFPLGTVEEEKVILNNHLDIVVYYHVAGVDKYRVVGVHVIPDSRKDSKKPDSGEPDCGDPQQKLVLDEKGETSVTWTYGVYWIESETAWATRWDSYLHVFDPRIHWFSLINSAVIVVFLCGKHPHIKIANHGH